MLGIYRHYKGGMYRVIGVAQQSETGERLVIYEKLEDVEHKLWARPEQMFLESVSIDGRTVPRFELVSD
jgi:hypothetical protein